MSSVNRAASPKLAARWMEELSIYKSPEAAEASDSGIAIRRFKDGEWLIGKAQNSHGLWPPGGGTLVVRSSRGNTTAYSQGHVCGPGYFQRELDQTDSLDSFYELLNYDEFVELPEGQLKRR